MILYKYFRWPNQGENYTEEVLLNNKLFFSSPAQFNDPFDHKVYLPYIGTRDEDKAILEWIIWECNRSDAQGDVGAREWLYSGILENFDEYKNRTMEKIIEKFRKNTGICCFTTEKNNTLMWSHYADSHKGICVGFDFSKDINRYIQPRKVIYTEDYPVAELFSENFFDNFYQGLFTKSLQWKYENEYRAIQPVANVCLPYSKECIVEIIMGCQISPQTKIEIKEIINRTFKHAVKLYQCRIDNQKYRLIYDSISG